MPSTAASRLALALVACLAVGACQQAPPEAPKPRRKSFSDSGWQPSAPAAPPASASSSVEGQAQDVQQTWEQARQAESEAERQRLANEALERTRQMADQPSAPPQ